MCLNRKVLIGLTDLVLVDGARRSTLEEVTEWTIWADKVASC